MVFVGSLILLVLLFLLLRTTIEIAVSLVMICWGLIQVAVGLVMIVVAGAGLVIQWIIRRLLGSQPEPVITIIIEDDHTEAPTIEPLL